MERRYCARGVREDLWAGGAGSVVVEGGVVLVECGWVVGLEKWLVLGWLVLLLVLLLLLRLRWVSRMWTHR